MFRTSKFFFDLSISFSFLYFVVAFFLYIFHKRRRFIFVVESSWNVMAHGDARERKWRGNWRMGWVASTLHTTSERGVSSITTADERTSVANSRLNWRPRQLKLTRPFRRKTKSVFCACAITFRTHYTDLVKVRMSDSCSCLVEGEVCVSEFVYLSSVYLSEKKVT